jgi:CTP:molybdopterin cytidylyltransferase MocA
MPTSVAGVLLAAGAGSRLGRPKALIELGGRTLAERGVATLTAGGADPVLLVTGAVEVRVTDARVVPNPDWRTGMGSSVRAALADLAGLQAVGAVVIALADQPLVGAGSVRRLIAAYRDGASVAVAAYDGKPRNPVLIARQHWPAVAESAAGDSGARAFLRARPELVALIECGDTGRPDDIDTPDDLARISPNLRSRSQLTGSDAPGMGDLVARLENQQVFAGDEGVRRAGHRLDGDRLAAAVGAERITGEHLQPAIALARPQADPVSVSR